MCWTPPAKADLEFCPSGSGAGQCSTSVRGLAVDHETERLYITDEGNNRISVFEEDGDFLFAFGWGVADGTTNALQSCGPAATPSTAACFKGISGSGPGQLNAPQIVAVDNITGSPSKHAIYVAERPNRRVQKFTPTGDFVWMVGEKANKTTNADLCTKASGDTCGAGENSEAEGGFFSDIGSRIFVGVGPGGVLHVVDTLHGAQHRLQRFKDTGELIPPHCIFFEGGPVRAFAVEAIGGFWVANEGEESAIRKYDSTCAQQVGPLDADIETRPNSLALDEAGGLFAAQREDRVNGPGEFQVVTVRDADGNIQRRFSYGKLPFPALLVDGLAVGQAGVFAEQDSVSIKRLDFPPPTPPLPPPGPITATPSLEVPEIGSTKATLQAEVNPEGKGTTVRFEYLTEEAFIEQGGFTGPETQSTLPEPLSIPPGREFKLNGADALIGCPNPATEAEESGNDCLIPETKYRWRVIATNADGAGEGTAEGPPFETQKSVEPGEIYATGPSTDTVRLHGEADPNSVPASGFFEYVEDAQFQESGFANATKAPNVDEGQAPLDFGAGEVPTTRSVAIFPLKPGTTYHYRLVLDNALIEPEVGEVKTVRTFSPPEAEPCPGNAPSRIGAGAFLPDCRAYELVSPLEKGGGDIRVLRTNLGILAVLEQSADSGEKLAFGSVRSFGDAASAPFTSQYVARRIAGKEWETHSINPPRGRPFVEAVGQFETEFKAFSADLCQGWLTTFAEFPDAPPGTVPELSNLFRRSDRLCGPEGFEPLAPLAPPEGLGPGGDLVLELRGVSADGEHAIFKSNGKLAPEGSASSTQLYESVEGGPPRLVCILPVAVSGSCTSGSNPISGGKGIAAARPISEDGERIYWSAPGNGEGKIYVRIGGTQTVEVSKGAEVEEGTNQSFFWGAAADGSAAILTSGNLGTSDATLFRFELEGEATTPLAEGVLGVMGVSEDADRVYFASEKVLAPGGVEGKANLYLHEAGEGGGSTEFVATLAGGDLGASASTNPYYEHTAQITPDGLHAAFVSVAPLTGYDNKAATDGTPTQQLYRYDAAGSELTCLSCNPSGARPAGRSTIPFFQSEMRGARVISDDGNRLYFESADSLVARDSNGHVDVYQWEEEGAGGCGAADANFSADSGGCVELISSGQSPLDARFVDSTPSGNDVFFATGASLLPQDHGVVDIYDARVNGGLPVPIPPDDLCEGDACRTPPPAPEEPTPASAGYEGPPEAATAPARKRCAKGKRRAVRKGKARCVPKRRAKRGRAAR